MATEIQELQQFYRNYNIPLSTEWLECCIEWCKDGNLPPNYTVQDMQRMVYDQWLILDLRDVEVPSLPRNLSNEKKYSLTGSYCLQMMQVVDISKPKLWQLQRIRNNLAKNTEVERDFGKRVLQLTLTDGVQEIEAMEFFPIPCLNINLYPGTKIRITGPLMVRNGRLMLKEENVKYLGGAVDEIKVQFAAENVLARALRLEENPNPHIIDENALEVTEENTTTPMNSTTNTQNYNAVNQNRNQHQNNQAQSRNSTSTNTNINRNNQNAASYNQDISRTQNIVSNRCNNQDIPLEFQVDDDLLRELEADFEVQSLRSTMQTAAANTRNTNNDTNSSNLKANLVPKPMAKPIKNVKSRNCSSPDLFEDQEVDDDLLNKCWDRIDIEQMASNSRKGRSSDITGRLDSYGPLRGGSTGKIRTSGFDKNAKLVQDLEVSSSVIAKTKPSTSELIIALDDSFEDIDIDSHLDNIDEEMANLPSSTQKRNDLKNRVPSPELKSRKLSSYTPKTDTDGTNLTREKKLLQGTLNFVSSKKADLNLPLSMNLNSTETEDNNPFSIFKKPTQKSTPIPEFSAMSKTPYFQPQESSLMRPDSPVLKPKYLPNAASQKPSRLNIADYESNNHQPSTSKTSSSVPKDVAPSSPEPRKSPPSSLKVLTIEKLRKMIPNVGKGKFKIKGKFKAVAEKFQHKEYGYRFVIVVEDGTADLTVLLHSDLVTSIMGIAPQELAELKALAFQENEEVRSEIMERFTSLHERCLTLDNILEIQVTRGEKYPVVTNII